MRPEREHTLVPKNVRLGRLWSVLRETASGTVRLRRRTVAASDKSKARLTLFDGQGGKRALPPVGGTGSRRTEYLIEDPSQRDPRRSVAVKDGGK